MHDETTSAESAATDSSGPSPLFGARTLGATRAESPTRSADPASDSSMTRTPVDDASTDRDATTAIPVDDGPAATGSPAVNTSTSDVTTATAIDDPAPSAGHEEPPRRSGPDRRGLPSWARWAAIPVVLLLLAAAWVGWLFADRAGTALPGVTVEGFDASGMDEAAITAELDNIVINRRDAEVVVAIGEPLDGESTFRLGADGYDADVDGTVDEALAAGRDGPFGSIASQVRAALGQTSWVIPLRGESIDADVDAFLADVTTEVDREPTAGGVTIEADTLEVSAEEPEEGYRAEVEEVRTDLEELAGTGEDAELTIPVTVLDPLVDPANVEQVADRARAVLAEAYVLVNGDQSLTIDPSEIVELISVDETDDGYGLSIDGDGVVAMLDGRGERFYVAPKSASYDVQTVDRTFDNKGSSTFDPSPATVTVVEGRNGRAFNAEVAGARLVELFEAGEHSGEFELDVIEADFTNEEAQAGKPDALLGTFTTYHDAGGNRVFNIHLLADMIDGEVLPPGDDFSVNRDIGDRTEDKGFKPAGAIKEGEIIDDDIGGGVSQLATTFYNAAFFSGIDVLSWKPHSLPISRYPLAREATFSYAGGLDIHIENTTEGAIVVKTSYTDSSITVSIYGQDDGRTVRANMGEPKNYTDFDVQERGTDELCQGQSRTVQTGGQGFTVDYERVIKGGTNPKTEDFSWAYSPKPTIIENGTRNC